MRLPKLPKDMHQTRKYRNLNWEILAGNKFRGITVLPLMP